MDEGLKTPNKKFDTCVKCNQRVQFIRDALECIICHRRTHLSCTEGRPSDELGALMRKSSNGFNYTCYHCTKLLSKDASNKSLIDGTEGSKFWQQKCKLDSDTLRNECKRFKNLATLLEEENLSLKRTIQVGHKDSNAEELNMLVDVANEKDITISKLEQKCRELESRNAAVDQKDEIILSLQRRCAALEAANKPGPSQALPATPLVSDDTSGTEVNVLKDKAENLTLVVSSLVASVNILIVTDDKTVERPTAVVTAPARPRNNAVSPRVSTPATSTMTYAQALAKSSIPQEAIKNIELKPASGNCEALLQQIQSDNICAGKNIVSIKQRGKCNLILKCSDAKSANEVEETLKTKYGEAIDVKGINGSRPQVKITRLPCDESLDQDLLQQILEQNIWLKDAILTIERSYSVTTEKLKYRNLIISCELDIQKLILQKGFVICGMKECRCFENVNMIQCHKCARFGHFVRDCTFPARCRKCSADHETKECTTIPKLHRCANCISSNSRGTNYDTRHRSSDDRCPVRIARIEALKNYLQSKN